VVAIPETTIGGRFEGSTVDRRGKSPDGEGKKILKQMNNIQAQ